MRTGQAIKLAGRLRSQHFVEVSKFKISASMEQLASTFGDCSYLLPGSIPTELLFPHLQRFSHRKPLFDKLNTSGTLLLTIMLNQHMGTRNLELPERLLSQFCEKHRVGHHNTLTQYIGAVDLFVGHKECAEMVANRILGGVDGLSNMYLSLIAHE